MEKVIKNVSQAPSSLGPEPVQEQSIKQSLKDSVWQRLLIFLILFPLGMIAFVMTWVFSITAMINLGGYGDNPWVTPLSIIALILVKPALYFSSWIQMGLSALPGIESVSSFFILLFVDAIYVYIIASVIGAFLWRKKLRVPNVISRVLVVVLTVAIVGWFVPTYMSGGLKDITGEKAVEVYTEEDPGYSWDDLMKQKSDAFATYPQETFDDVIINGIVAGYEPRTDDIANSVYDTQTTFGMRYNKKLSNGKTSGTAMYINTRSSSLDVKEDFNNYLNGFSPDIIDGNKVWRLRGKWASDTPNPYEGSYVRWVSGRRYIDGFHSYPVGYDGEEESLQFIKEYLKKYPSDL